MTVALLEYNLEAGFVHNWLVAGPQILPVADSTLLAGDVSERKPLIAQHFYNPEVGFSGEPVDRDVFNVDGVELSWRYRRCTDDHFVTVSTFCPTWSCLHYWAYTRLRSAAAQPITLILTTLAPADVWVNGQHVYRQETFSGQQPHSVRIPVSLESGENQVMVRLEQVAAGAAACVLALQVVDFPADDEDKEVSVAVPTCANHPYRHQMFERAFDFAYLEEVVNYRGAHFNLRWADDVDTRCRFNFQIQDANEFFYVDGNGENDPNEVLDIGHTFRLFERPFWVVLRATGKEYFDQNMRYERRMPLYVLDNAYSTAAYDNMAGRRHEALVEAAKYNQNLFAEIAKIELKRWEGIDHSGVRWSPFDSKYVEEVIAQVKRREAGSEINLVGLLAMLYRYVNDAAFPVKLKPALKKCVLNFRYGQDEPGGDAMDFTSESHSILFHTGEILAGQLYPRHKFTNTGKTGRWHQEKGEAMALDWLHQRASRGFQGWHSPDNFELIIVALTHLTSLAKNEAVQELAAVVLDKLFFSMAVNSFKGVMGVTHGSVSASMLKSAQLEATAGVSRLLWGLGVYNPSFLGAVSLATSEYEFPTMIGEIAADTPKSILSKERHVVDPAMGIEANTVTYRTPDYMLSSVQDYRPGQPGATEHVWQATLGTEAVVFANHPGCMSEDEAYQPGFWRGNRILPRVAQWKDVLIAVYKLPEDDWMGFTHAYFPTCAFEAYEIKGNWAFAKKGDGYLALTCSQGFKLNKHQPDGYRELRSSGAYNIWVCHMGRAALDESFEKFKRRILKIKLDWQDLAVSFKTLHYDKISFGWEGALTVNGVERPITGFKHVENPYCVADLPAAQMDISYNGTTMRLDFS